MFSQAEEQYKHNHSWTNSVFCFMDQPSLHHYSCGRQGGSERLSTKRISIFLKTWK